MIFSPNAKTYTIFYIKNVNIRIFSHLTQTIPNLKCSGKSCNKLSIIVQMKKKNMTSKDITRYEIT